MATSSENLTEIGLVFSEEGYDSLQDKIKKTAEGVKVLAEAEEARVAAAAKVAAATSQLSTQLDKSIIGYQGSKAALFEYRAEQLGVTDALAEQIVQLMLLEQHTKEQADAFKKRQQDMRNERGLMEDYGKDQVLQSKALQAQQAEAAKIARALEDDRIKDIQNNALYEKRMRDGLAADKLKDELIYQKHVQDTKAYKIKADAEAMANARKVNAEAIALAEKQAISEINWAKKSRDEQIRIKQEVATYRAAGVSDKTIAGTFGSASLTGAVKPVQIPVDVERFQRDTGMMRDSAFMLRNALATLGVSFSVTGLIRLSDTYSMVSGKILNATTSVSQFNFVMSDAMRIATNAQADVGSIAQSYGRLINNTRELGASQKSLSLVVEASALALKVNGATVQETTSALQQLSQAFGKGKLDGDEFRTLMEASPGLMRQVAESMGVPFGALKDLAKQGAITGDVLVKALSDQRYVEELRKQAKEMMTISGAFQVLTNNLVMFVGESSKSSGVVRVLSTALVGLGENLSIVVGLLATVAASKLAQWLATTAAGFYAQAVARQTALAATLASARADAVATGQAVALTTARVAELRAAVLASSGNVALAVTTNGLIPAQARAAAAATAHAAALSTLSVAARAASVSTALGAGAMALLGGPIGAVVALLGVGAVAWANWGNSSKNASEQAAAATEASTGEILQNLEKQNEKLRERIRLANAGNIAVATQTSPEAEKLASTFSKMEAIRAKGTAATNSEKLDYIELKSIYDRLNKSLAERVALQAQSDRIGQQSKASEWMEKLANKTEKMNEELKKARTELGDSFSPEIEKRIRAKYAEAAKAPKAIVENSFVGLNKFVQDQEREFQAATKHTGRMIAENEKRFAAEKSLTDDAYALARDNADTKSAIGVAEISVYTNYVRTVKSLNEGLLKDQLLQLDKEVAIGQLRTDAIVKQANEQVIKTEDGLLRKQAIIDAARDKQAALVQKREDDGAALGSRSKDNVAEAESQAYKQSVADINRLVDASNKRLAQREQEYAAIGLTKQRVRELAELEEEKNAKQIAAAIAQETLAMQAEGLSQKEIDMYKQRIDKLQQLYANTARFIELNEVLKARQEDWQAGVMEGFHNYLDTVDNTFESAKKLTEQTFKGMEDALSGFVMTGKLNFANLFSTLGAGLARLYIQSKLLGPIADALNGKNSGGTFGSGGGGIMQSVLGGVGKFFGLGGASTSSTVYGTTGGFGTMGFGGFYAAGGNPPVGKPYIVGENGPEWHVDRTPSTILPNGQAPAGMGQSVNVYNTFVLQQPADQRTQDQIAVKAGQSITRATQRNT